MALIPPLTQARPIREAEIRTAKNPGSRDLKHSSGTVIASGL